MLSPPAARLPPAASPLNNSTHTRTFNLERETSWSNQDFEVEEVNGTALLRVETRFDRQDAEAFQMLVTTPTQHQFTIGLESQPDINPHLEACGHKQTYRTTDRVDFECNPRIFLVDRWRIKRGAGTALTRDYIWHRKAMGLAGPIRDESGRHVAHFRARTLGQEWLAMLWHTKGSHVTTYTIETNDEIPIEYLAALYSVAIVRMDKCGR